MHLRLKLQSLTLAFLSCFLWSEYIVFLLMENGDLYYKVTWIFEKGFTFNFNGAKSHDS